MKDLTKIENIRLEFACDKNWSEMISCNDGRHCTFCSRKVFDFTNKSFDEFQKIKLKYNGEVCGPFTAEQIISAPSKRVSTLKRLAAALFLFFGMNLYSKTLSAQIDDFPDTSQQLTKDSIQTYFLGTIVEEMPSYKNGGEQGLMSFLGENIIYPSDSVSGKVYVSFVVDKSGKLTDIKIRRGLSPAADKEALRLTNLLEYKAGIQNGKPISVAYNLPISFTPHFYDAYMSKKLKSKPKDK